MNHLSLILPGVMILSTPVYAQQVTPAPSPGRTTKAPAQKEVDPEILQRRSVARSMLQSLAIEARSYRDEALRARVQARAADVLWDEDRESARGLFRRAWEAAEAVEAQAPVTSAASLPGRIANNRPPRPRTNLRAEILRLAARRDRALGEEFLTKLAASMRDEAERSNDSARNSSGSSPISQAEIAERLRLASQFLEADNLERALQFADPALVQVSMSAIQFLVTLRDKNPGFADQRFAALLSRAAADNTTDANTVSLLTSYVFTPSHYLVVSNTGIPSSMAFLPRPAPTLAPALRAAYFQVAANILLRPFAQLDQSSAGRAGTYFIATRLYPLFLQFAPELAPAINAQLAALGPQASQATVRSSDWLNQGMTRDDPAGDGIGDELKDRLSRAQSADARDRAYAFAAMRAADAGDPRARDFVDKIEDLDTRNGIRSFVDFSFIGGLLKKKKVDEAIQLARKSDLSSPLRAHVLTQAAAIVANSDRGRAIELLGEALTETRRIDPSTAERAYCLVALLAQFSKLDKARGWDLLAETVKAANAVADFTGEDGHTSQTLEGKFSIRMGTELASATDLSNIFLSLAEDNLYQAIDAGKTFSGDAPRAMVTISIARSVLEEKRNQAPKPSQ
ncbi:MAG: hypothetical protein DMF70_07570 [Acidobacteria bacterium]|nr:MAG: hypothetical protein DMF70_07570 [Acidobacteriota bacterium]